jgi:hypothetical protein
MSFLKALSDQLSSQFSLGENQNKDLDSRDSNGTLVKYGALGAFAQQFDQSAERRYLEEGYLRNDPYKATPKQLEILMQQPNATILVKKRMFSSIAENFRPDYMDKDEKLYFRSIKILFQNKCNQIAALEKLSKIQKISSVLGQIDNYMVPIIISLTDALSNAKYSDQDYNADESTFQKTINRLRRVYAYNTSSPYTNWVIDSTNLFKSQYAEGTGVIEITNFTNLNTTVSVGESLSNCNFAISDPYQAMIITEYDIERAIADATNVFYNSKTFLTAKENITLLINELENRLNQQRRVRGVSSISFKINPDTLLGKRVTVIIDRMGIEIPFTYDSSIDAIFGLSGDEVSVDREYLINGQIAGINGLDNGVGSSKKQTKTALGVDISTFNTGRKQETELSIFKRLVKAIFHSLSLTANSQNALQTANDKTNYTRRKLRFNFLGKLIIQPRDLVHIYLASKSKYDNKILAGLNNSFSGLGTLQSISKGFSDLRDSWNNIFNTKTALFQIEKASFVGTSFPDFLWSMMRGQFVCEKEGTHVFAGIVERSGSSWQNNSFSVNITCKDNMNYLEMGVVNFNPGVDIFNGSIFDPLTPFKMDFDKITSNAKDNTLDFLEENKYLLTDKGSEVLAKHKAGPSVGQKFTENGIFQDKSVDRLSGLLTRTFYAPDGLVYKWKEGIGVLVQFGNSLELNQPERTGSPNIYNSPFAGQDVINTISLLVTGTPYNFANFWKATTSAGYSGDKQNNENSAKTFYESLTESLSKNNLLWGNFIPFKTLTIDESTYAQRIQGQFDFQNQNDDLNNKLKKLQEISQELNNFQVIKSLDVIGQLKTEQKSIGNRETDLKAQYQKLTEEINSAIRSLSEKDESFYANQGDELTYDSNNEINSFINNNDPNSDKILENSKYRKMMRRQINYLTRRMSYNVRANDDKNLFIVDDFYDKDYDIMAYNKSLAQNLTLFNNKYENVRQKARNVASILNLEFFCDTQGHIRVRPPQYNRIPSSVFYRMMYLKQFHNIALFPQFIDDLFKDQISTIKSQIELVELYIRFNGAVLGKQTDEEVIALIIKRFADSNTGSNRGNGNVGEDFRFISDAKTFNIINIEEIIKNANPDPTKSQSADKLTSIKNQAISNKDIFRTVDRAQFIIESISNDKLNKEGYGASAILSNNRLTEIIDNIFYRSGQKININDYIKNRQIISEGKVIYSTSDSIVDIFKTTQELSTKIAERQKAVKLYYSMIKNWIEYKSLDDKKNPVNNQMLLQTSYGNSNVPEVFEHMIEDETYDDYGPGSGNRYIIKNSQIKHITIEEKPPSFNYIKVEGNFSDYTDNNVLPQGFNSSATVSGGPGSGMTTAVALDYDMWRNYGLIQATDVNLAFLRDPNTQCAPFATMMLSRARKEILGGSIMISGNEYMQPGEVVYIEDRGLLFYVDSVSHSFAFGGDFTTNLQLSYGHSPGEYIPTTLDVIGKMIYNNRDLSTIIVNRQSNAYNEKPLGVILYDGNSNYAKEDFSAPNTSTINNVLYNVQYYLNKNAKNQTSANLAHEAAHVGTTSKPKLSYKVKLRIYYNNEPDNDLQEFAAFVKNVLIQGQVTVNNTPAKVPYIIQEGAIEVQPINMSDDNDSCSPSQKAINAARDKVSTLSTTSFSQNESVDNSQKQQDIKKQRSKIAKALYKYVIDCWLVQEKE